MDQFTVTFLPEGISVPVTGETTLLQAQIAAGLRPDAPCGGKGTCGKCSVIINGETHLACRTKVHQNMTVRTKGESGVKALTEGCAAASIPDGADKYVMAFDVGTTTVVAYLLDGYSGKLLARESCVNPQVQFGADVISRIQYALRGGREAMSRCIRTAMEELVKQTAEKAGIAPEAIGSASIAGNTAMHHLLLNIDPKPLVTPPYMPAVSEALELTADCHVRVLPNIAGFVGGDTVGCMIAAGFDTLEELTLLIDIGTNGEMVLGNKNRRIACSTAAGPAFEGANISCGMRGAEGAVDHVMLEEGNVTYHVIGDSAPKGLCGSGLLDLAAVLLDLKKISPSGRMAEKRYVLCDNVVLTQKDVREVQLAKAAIRSGIELLAERMGVQLTDIRRVYLAGAFGNYMNPVSACRIGMIPSVLMDRIHPIGNAAGEGAKLCALRNETFLLSRQLAKETEFLDLARLPQFQSCYVKALNFPEEE